MKRVFCRHPDGEFLPEPRTCQQREKSKMCFTEKSGLNRSKQQRKKPPTAFLGSVYTAQAVKHKKHRPAFTPASARRPDELNIWWQSMGIDQSHQMLLFLGAAREKPNSNVSLVEKETG